MNGAVPKNGGELPYVEITPEPGYVVKTRFKPVISADDGADALRTTANSNNQDQKVFINLCHSSLIPPPPLISDEDLAKALEKGDSESYRIPLSLSPLKKSSDNKGVECVVLDVCVNNGPYEKSKLDGAFRSFLLELSIQWMEQRFDWMVDRSMTFPNLKVKGILSTHRIRRPTHPVIDDITSDSKSLNKKKEIEEPKWEEPRYTLVMEPPEDPEFIVVEVQLPKVDTLLAATLDIEKRQMLFASPGSYSMNLALPVDIDTLEGGAQFDRRTRMLTVTLQALKM